MKTIQCYDCEAFFQAGTREEILSKLYDHYITEHTAIITQASVEEKKSWMERFEKDWAAADGE